MCLGTTRIRHYPSNTTYLLLIRVATCFDTTVSSSGLHYEPVMLESCVHSWDSKQCSQLSNTKGSCTQRTIVNIDDWLTVHHNITLFLSPN
jgi:hypothetical protein